MAGVLEILIAKDYTIIGNAQSKWAKTEEHDSLVIDKDNQLFFWNSRNIAGDALVWLTKIKGLSFGEARKVLADFPKYTETFVYTIKGANESQDVIVYPKLVDVFWERGLNNRQYWYERLLDDSTINRFKLGYYDGWYFIPFFVDGTLRNFQCRRDLPKKTIRPWYTGVGPLLYNSDILNLVSDVIITEGTVDAILLNQLGFPAISHNVGADWKHQWFSKFLTIKNIIYIADYDKAGLKAFKKVATSLSDKRVRIATFYGYEEKTDTIEFFKNGGTIEEFKNILNNAKYLYEFDERNYL